VTSCGDSDQRIGSEKFKLRPFHFRLENRIAIGDEFLVRDPFGFEVQV